MDDNNTTQYKIYNMSSSGGTGDQSETNDFKAADEAPKLETDVSRGFEPVQAQPAAKVFSTAAVGKRRYFDDGSKTTDFVALVAQSNASYLSWVNRFNAAPPGRVQ
jgi:hypothetical protein